MSGDRGRFPERFRDGRKISHLFRDAGSSGFSVPDSSDCAVSFFVSERNGAKDEAAGRGSTTRRRRRSGLDSRNRPDITRPC